MQRYVAVGLLQRARYSFNLYPLTIHACRKQRIARHGNGTREGSFANVPQPRVTHAGGECSACRAALHPDAPARGDPRRQWAENVRVNAGALTILIWLAESVHT